MHIFYGVQGTGNGHITRARVMAKELYKAGFEVDFQFTGRPFDKYFEMAVFNGYQLRHGLTFEVEKGEVSYIKTFLKSKPITFIKDVNKLNLSAYDLVISDFEPVTAWTAKTQGVPVIGLGHQYAFKHDIPTKGGDPLAKLVMKYFAPADTHIGLHWHHFGQPILPPIIEHQDALPAVIKNKIIVYLPFEDTKTVIEHLRPFDKFEFHIYSPEDATSPVDYINCNPLSREKFQEDLKDCAGVISNAGFELASEALMLGKKILVKPLHAQMEQISNAAALKKLGYGQVMNDLDSLVIDHWLHNGHAVQVSFPNTAKILVEWLLNGMPEMNDDYIEHVWNKVDVVNINH